MLLQIYFFIFWEFLAICANQNVHKTYNEGAHLYSWNKTYFSLSSTIQNGLIKQDSSQQILARRKSSKSQNGGTRIYAKLMAVANSRSRKPSLTSVGSTGKSQKEILLKKIIFLKFAWIWFFRRKKANGKWKFHSVSSRYWCGPQSHLRRCSVCT